MYEKNVIYKIGGQEMNEFVPEYEKHGVREVWIINPIAQTVTVYMLNKLGRYGKPAIYQIDDDLIQSAVLSNFKVSLASFFKGENTFDAEWFETGVEQGITIDKTDAVCKISEQEKQEMKVVHRAADAGFKSECRFPYEDYCTWPDDERWELIDGIPFKMETPNVYHQKISMNLSYAIGGYLTYKASKVYAAPFDVRLYIDGIKDTVVQPDILVICDLDIIDCKGAKGSPDLVIEILSPSSAEKDQVLKLAKYEEHGVREFWIIDPIERNVSVYLLNELGRYDKPMAYHSSDDFIHASVLSHFKINMTNIFTEENLVNYEVYETLREYGALEKAKQIAKTMLNDGFSLEEVAKRTELDLDIILKL